MQQLSPRADRAPSLRADRDVPWDKLNSTFYWNMYVNIAHRYSPGVQIITGYSKKIGQDEAKDKHQLLNRKIQTVFGVNGWLKKCDKIEIYHKRGAIINKADDALVVILYPRTYQIQSQYIAQKYQPLHNFLIDFYDCVVHGKEFTSLLPKSRATWSKDDYLNVDLLHFPTPAKLDEYCTRLVRNGHAFPAVVQFREKYITKKPFKL